MKTHLIITAAIVATLILFSCSSIENFEYKLTIVPESISQAVTPDNMNASADIICRRLTNSMGIPRKSIETHVTENQISLTISGIEASKAESIKEVITGNVRLEFRETYENSEIIGSLIKANNLLRELKGGNVRDSLDFKVQNPLLGKLSPRTTVEGKPLSSCMIGLAAAKDTGTVNGYLKMTGLKALFPHDIKFLWSLNPHSYDHSKTLYELHAVRVTSHDGSAPLDGSVITSAEAVDGHKKGEKNIRLTMTAEGAVKWAAITRENIGRCISVVLNGYVCSYPVVQAEISGGMTEISGDFTAEEAEKLAGILKSGQLPVKLKIIDEQIEGSSKK